jgi:hypothetical protein
LVREGNFGKNAESADRRIEARAFWIREGGLFEAGSGRGFLHGSAGASPLYLAIRDIFPLLEVARKGGKIGGARR